MPKQSFYINDFSGGLNSNSQDSMKIKDNEFSLALNTRLDESGTISIGGDLGYYLKDLPHDNSNFQVGYGLFATSFDTGSSVIDAQFESGFEEGTVSACSGTTLTLATLPTFQSVSNHSTDDFYNNMTVVIVANNGIGESRRIVDYTGSNKQATITEAFSGSVNSSSKYKIYNCAGDNTKFGNDGGATFDLDYIDKGGTTFPYDDIDAHDENYPNSYFLRTKSDTLTDGTSDNLGFVTFNPNKSASWANTDALGTESTTIGNTTLQSGIVYTMSFWCKAKYQYYGYGADANSSSQRRERVPFVQMYSDSVTDGTNTGLYLFQGKDGVSFQSGSETTYDYADNLTTEYVKNGDFEGGTIHGGNGGHGGATDYDPPTDWMAYDGFAHNTNNTITYTFISGADSFGADSTGTSGNTLNMNPGSSFKLANYNDLGVMPNCYMYQDLTLEDNQWYELSFVYSTDKGLCAFSLVDTFDLTSTGIVSNESTLSATDGDAVLTVDGTAATDALVLNREIYTSNGTFLGVCTAVNSTTEIRFAAGTAADIPNDTTLYTAKYIKSWNDNLEANNHTGGLTSYCYGGKEKKRGQKIPYRFFVPENSGTARKIRLAFSPQYHDQNLRLDSISVKKSFPDLVSMTNSSNLHRNPIGNPYSEQVTSWNEYKFQFKIPSKYDNATDWVINLNAGSYYYQAGATDSQTHQIVYFDGLKIESNDVSDNLIFLNDNTSTESKINIYSENNNRWTDNTSLFWKGINMKPVYTYINGMLKISDANFESGNTSKLFYYHNNKYNVRDNPISSPPALSVSAGGNFGEIDLTFNALDYINTYTYETNHQYYLVGDTKTATNWPLDDLDGSKEGLGRIIRYYHNRTNDQPDDRFPLKDSTGTELTKVDTGFPPEESTVTNPMYFTWCGTHGGSGDIATYDMHSSISGTSTGSIKRITFEFTYSFQGHRGDDSPNYKLPEKIYPPKFIIKAGKRSGTDVFGSGTDVNDNHQRDLSLGDPDFVEMENIKEATIYVDKIDGEEYDIQSEIDADITWEHSQLWPWDINENVIGGGTQYSRKSEKTFYGQISFDDSQIELADDIILEFKVEYPERGGYNMIDSLFYNRDATSGAQSFPRWEKVTFDHLTTYFRSSNWTAVTDGFTASESTKTKVNFSFGTPSGLTGFGWEERIFELGVSSVNIFDEESNINPNSTLIGTLETNLTETSSSSITAGQCPDIDIYIGQDAFEDEYRKKLKYYMKDTNSNIWYLQFYIDLETNTAFSTTSNFKVSGDLNETERHYHYFIPKGKILNYNEVDSYESQTLVSQDLTKAQLVCDYKTAVIANNRLYVGNIRQDGEVLPDRMIKSPIGKYNILPKDNFIDVLINDGDEIIALEYFKDKLLQFKQRKVFIINISGDYEFLEDTFDNIGINLPFQVTKTPYGIVWVNAKGCFIYDGQKLTNLIEGKIPNDDILLNSTWYWYVSDNINNFDKMLSIGWNGKTNEIIVKRGHYNESSGVNALITADGFVYNFNTNSWYSTFKSMIFNSSHTYHPKLSNFATTKDGDCICYGSINSSETGYAVNLNHINKWIHAQANDKSSGMLAELGVSETTYQMISFKTKQYDLGDFSRQKKIYKVIVNYSCSNSASKVSCKAILTHYDDNFDYNVIGSDYTKTSNEYDFDNSSINYDTTNGFTHTNKGNIAGNIDLRAELVPQSGNKTYFDNAYSIGLSFQGIALEQNNDFILKSIQIIYRNKRIK